MNTVLRITLLQCLRRPLQPRLWALILSRAATQYKPMVSLDLDKVAYLNDEVNLFFLDLN